MHLLGDPCRQVRSVLECSLEMEEWVRLENHHRVVVKLHTVLEAGRHTVEVEADRMAD